MGYFICIIGIIYKYYSFFKISFIIFKWCFVCNSKKCSVALVWWTEDLSITLYTCLEFDKHVANIMHSGHVRTNLILKPFVSRDPTLMTENFVTYVSLLLEYCAPWSLISISCWSNKKTLKPSNADLLRVQNYSYSLRLKLS